MLLLSIMRHEALDTISAGGMVAKDINVDDPTPGVLRLILILRESQYWGGWGLDYASRLCCN